MADRDGSSRGAGVLGDRHPVRAPAGACIFLVRAVVPLAESGCNASRRSKPMDAASRSKLRRSVQPLAGTHIRVPASTASPPTGS
jgi:hypothetical protein